MNGMFNPIVFYPSAIFMILFAILAIKFKNIFYSLLSAILVFFFAGFFFYVLGSEYNAVIQIAIYGVAVPVVLGLAVMFTNLKKEDKTEVKNSNLKYVLFLTCGIFILALLYLVMTSKITSSFGFNVSENIGNTGVQVLSAFSQGIYVNYIYAFELIALILTIIVVGITLLNKDKFRGDK